MPVHSADQPTDGVAARLARLVGSKAGTAAVFGAPVERAGVTVIPVARTRFGFGGGGGPDPAGRGEGRGRAGGATSRPLGFIEIRNGRARFRRITDPLIVGVVLVAIATAAAILARAARHPGCSECRDCRSQTTDPSPAPNAPLQETPAP